MLLRVPRMQLLEGAVCSVQHARGESAQVVDDAEIAHIEVDL